MTLRVVFMGTPDFSVPALSEIIGAGHEVAAAYSQPPRPAGRGMEPRKSPVQAAAEAAGIAVFTPQSLKDKTEQAAFQAHAADVAVVVAYGLLLPKAILEAPRLGCLNLHASALPRWRGAAPIQRAIMAGDTETAMTVMKMDEGLDTGPVCLAERVAISEQMTAGQLHDRLALLGGDLILRALAALERGTLTATPQPDSGVTYATKITKDEGRIDFSQHARVVDHRVRGLSPHPGAWFEVPAGMKSERIKILSCVVANGAGIPGTVLDGALTVACGDGAIRILEVQRQGKRPMTTAEFLRGFALVAGTRLG
ncbi:MAG: methionyl-tRNA formyltransferase [Hyphomicrobium sp.]|nr:methionyl-tRNA formyltransferase [Hyphomicrobium sp.]